MNDKKWDGGEKDLADSLNAELKIIENGGHLNKSSGYTKFPKLLKDIQAFYKSKQTENQESE